MSDSARPDDGREAKRARTAAVPVGQEEPAAGAAAAGASDDPLLQVATEKVDHSIIDRFKAGFSLWKRDMLAKDPNFSAAMQEKSPKVLLIACSDMRINATSICHAAPGELYPVRNVGNMVRGGGP